MLPDTSLLRSAGGSRDLIILICEFHLPRGRRDRERDATAPGAHQPAAARPHGTARGPSSSLRCSSALQFLSRAAREFQKPICRAPSMASTPSMAPNGRRRAPCHAQRPLQRPNGPTLQRSNGPTACDAQRPLRYGYSRRLLLCALLTVYSRPQPHCFRLCLSFSVACLTSSTALAFAFSVSSYSSLSFLALA